MLIYLFLLVAITSLLGGYLYGTHLQYKQTLRLKTKALQLLDDKQDILDMLMEDNVRLALLLRQQYQLRQDYAQHLEQQEHYPSLTITNLN